jgi:hypothetical protein
MNWLSHFDQYFKTGGHNYEQFRSQDVNVIRKAHTTMDPGIRMKNFRFNFDKDHMRGKCAVYGENCAMSRGRSHIACSHACAIRRTMNVLQTTPTDDGEEDFVYYLS